MERQQALTFGILIAAAAAGTALIAFAGTAWASRGGDMFRDILLAGLAGCF